MAACSEVVSQLRCDSKGGGTATSYGEVGNINIYVLQRLSSVSRARAQPVKMHSTKEVMSGTGLEVSPDRTAPEALYPQNFQYNGYDTASQGPTVSLTNGKYHGREVPRVAGLRKPTFWLLVALFSVVALALGLGIGLGLGLRNHNVNNTGQMREIIKF